MSEIEQLFQKFEQMESRSLLKKHLTRSIVDDLGSVVTSNGGTLAKCVKTGVDNPDSHVGIHACDAESYTVFAAIFDPIIKEYHKIPPSLSISHPGCDFGEDSELAKLKALDPAGKYIISTRIRVGRSHARFEYPPVMSIEDRLTMEKMSRMAFDSLPEDLKGTYLPLNEMDNKTQEELIADHFLFKDFDKFHESSGCYNDWPNGRGIFLSKDKRFLSWVNEGDHLRFISMQEGGDIGQVYKRLISAVTSLETSLEFSHDDRLGFVTFCPSNLGTTLRASVHMRIPCVSRLSNFREICDKLHLQARGVHGEHTESEAGVYDISNKRRLGLTEIQLVMGMYNGVKDILKMEQEMTK